MTVATSRRGFLRGLLAAPAIVSVGNIMPVRVPRLYGVSPAGLVLPAARELNQMRWMFIDGVAWNTLFRSMRRWWGFRMTRWKIRTAFMIVDTVKRVEAERIPGAIVWARAPLRLVVEALLRRQNAKGPGEPKLSGAVSGTVA